jgi:heme oxygenase
MSLHSDKKFSYLDKQEFLASELSPTEKIRVATRSLHNSLELTPIAQKLMSIDLNLPAYLRILKVWVEAWSSIEGAIARSAFAADMQWMLPGKRSEVGITELNTLEARYHSGAIQSDFGNRVMFQISPSLGALAGTCYVMRGAALGGKIIGKHLHNTLKLPDRVFASFYTADDTEQKHWGAWLKECNVLLNSPSVITEAVSGASDTYSFLIDQFENNPPF